MRRILVFLSAVCLAIAVIAAVVDGTKSIAASRIVTTPLGQAWFDLSRDSLNAAQALVQRYVHPAIWDPGIQTVLTLPAFAVFAALALVLYILGYRRPRPEPRSVR